MHHLIPIDWQPGGTAPVEVRVGLESQPALAEHGFQGMAVLPGAFYLELARQQHLRFTGQPKCVLRDVRFNRPAILSPEDTLIQIDAREVGDQTIEWRFSEAAGSPAANKTEELCRVTSTALHHKPSGLAADKLSDLVGTFKQQAAEAMTGTEFYQRLLENGNQYGPRFQAITGIWRQDSEALAELRVTPGPAGTELPTAQITLLDAVTQVLAVFILQRGETFALHSISQVRLLDDSVPGKLWAHAVMRRAAAENQDSACGDVQVFDQHGKAYLELEGVVLKLLGRCAAARDESAAVNIRIAANFTAEPVEDSLKFWGRHFNSPVRIDFAPYNQVFQQLLDPASLFHEKRDGINVLLLRLEEWIKSAPPPAAVPVNRDRLQSGFNGHARYSLPNGLDIVHLNDYETEHLYREIFEDETYLKHGIELPDSATVIDIGANIGLFSLFVLGRCRNPRIYAFEPSPVVFNLLKANCDAYGPNIRALNLGVGDRPGTATFTVYEKSSVFSGFHTDEAADRHAIRAAARNALRGRAGIEGDSLEQYLEELTAERLRRTSCECPLTSVSAFIREEGIDRIDLLKIDAEKSELDILHGIGEHDWPKIGQIVIEVHDPTRAAVHRVTELLEARGFHCAVEEEQALEQTGLFNVYARRSRCSPGNRVADEVRRKATEFCAALESFLGRNEAPLIVCLCPLNHVDEVLQEALTEVEQSLARLAERSPGLHLIDSTTLQRRYPMQHHFDAHARRLGDMPYNTEGYAAIGTAVFRAVFNLRAAPFKVIVLDCDNTLWKGVCGEAGPAGIELTAAYRVLQEFMIAQCDAGMLLCLCSKNNEADVWAVFEQRLDLPLKREHFIATRINWADKSANLRELAAELNLGLDSFIFIDDNPVECAAVKAGCPEVLTLQLPSDDRAILAFLDHVWAFDQSARSREGRNRTLRYRKNMEREKFRHEAFSLDEFIKGLHLRVTIDVPAEDQLGRVAELILRTNQFNFTARRRTESELRAFLRRETSRCLVAQVTDRFGDYGLVGAVVYEESGYRFKVDTLLLSCRVLGRGVEHQFLAGLGCRARAAGIEWVELSICPTGKNQPALQFFQSLADRYDREESPSTTAVVERGQGDSTTRIFPAEFLAGLRYDPSHEPFPPEVAAPGIPATRSGARPGDLVTGNLSEKLQRVASDWRDMARLVSAMESDRGLTPDSGDLAEQGPGSPLEVTLGSIWRKILGRPRVDVDDNFFEVGGTSIKAVQVIASIKRELGQGLPLVALFENPTITLLAARMSGGNDAREELARTQAGQRGRQRRVRKVRRSDPFVSR